jgi:Sporulation protein YtfJ (Spore_YtfJ)
VSCGNRLRFLGRLNITGTGPGDACSQPRENAPFCAEMDQEDGDDHHKSQNHPWVARQGSIHVRTELRQCPQSVGSICGEPGRSNDGLSEPISADGKTIVPVAKVRYGFGGGSGRKPGENGQHGGSGGGGFMARPVGYIEIGAEGTRTFPSLISNS